jgi:hypothetical protein
MITDTGEIAEALDVGAWRWPDFSRPEVLRHLVVRGAEAVLAEREERSKAVDALSELGIHYPPNYLEELREDWPE